jgi:hypothetical protein
MWSHSRILLLATTVALLLPREGRAQDGGSRRDWTAVDGALGRPGKAQPGDVRKYGFPRGDLA